MSPLFCFPHLYLTLDGVPITILPLFPCPLSCHARFDASYLTEQLPFSLPLLHYLHMCNKLCLLMIILPFSHHSLHFRLLYFSYLHIPLLPPPLLLSSSLLLSSPPPSTRPPPLPSPPDPRILPETRRTGCIGQCL